ncbi:MAG: NADH-quinone oxidoreductase subunit J family protein [Longimicrobiaceae bacterium]
MLTQLLFYLFGSVAVVSGVMTITRKNPVASALWLIGTFFALAAIYTLLGAFFIGVIQVLVYAGAIMVLFLFVIMLLNLGNQYQPDFRGKFWWVTAAGTGLVLVALLARVFAAQVPSPLGETAGPRAMATSMAEQGVVGAVGIPMYTDFVVPLQVTGLLLLVAIVGAVVLAKKSF